MNISWRIYRFLAVLMVGATLMGCVPTFGLMSKEEKKEYRQKKRCERKFKRFKRDCPESVKVDTIRVPVQIDVDSQSIAKSFEVNQDFSELDSIIGRYKALSDSVVGDNDSLINVILSGLGSDVIRYVKGRNCIQDTVRFDTTIVIMIDDQRMSINLTIGATQPNSGQITPFVEVPPQDLHSEMVFIEETPCPPELTIKEYIYQVLKDFWWLVLILTILFSLKGIIGFVKRNIIR